LGDKENLLTESSLNYSLLTVHCSLFTVKAVRSSGFILLLAYILGVLFAEVPGIPYVWLILGCIFAFAIPWIWRTGPRAELWITAGLTAFFASLYFQARVPQPSSTDVSQYAGQEIAVRGTVIETPTLNRDRNVRFVLEAQSVETQPPKPTSGKLYVTVPILQGTGLTLDREISVTGWLYEPQPPQNPGGFDFRAYLARKGVFAGLKGKTIDWETASEPSSWGWWALRERIVKALVEKLGVPEGTVVSAMVLGRRAVDLSDDVRDRFVNVGLAHALAASGFHVSLILGAVLGLRRNLGDRSKFILGSATLLMYVGLVGFQPSVLRAALMGFAGLVGLATQRRVHPVGALLVAATLLLLVNPLWIRDLGFQLSFLATLGLLVTVPPLVEKMDGLPPTISPLLAVPIAAIIWTLPLQLYVFGQTPTYSLVVNLLTMPFLSVVTLGGFLCGMVALVYPPAGSWAALALLYPVRGLLAMVNFFAELPGGSIAVDKIELASLYGVIGAGWWLTTREKPRFLKRWRSFSLLLLATVAGALVFVPAVVEKANLLRVTVLVTREQPSIAIQQGWNTTLVHSGDEDTTRYAVLPFLRQEGVNRLDTVVAMSDGAGWTLLFDTLPAHQVYGLDAIEVSDKDTWKALSPGMEIFDEALEIRSIVSNLPVLQFSLSGEKWLILGDLTREEQDILLESAELSQVSVLCFWGRSIDPHLLSVLSPSTLVVASEIDEFENREIAIFRLDREGAVQWTPQHSIEPVLETPMEF